MPSRSCRQHLPPHSQDPSFSRPSLSPNALPFPRVTFPDCRQHHDRIASRRASPSSPRRLRLLGVTISHAATPNAPPRCVLRRRLSPRNPHFDNSVRHQQVLRRRRRAHAAGLWRSPRRSHQSSSHRSHRRLLPPLPAWGRRSLAPRRRSALVTRAAAKRQSLSQRLSPPPTMHHLSLPPST